MHSLWCSQAPSRFNSRGVSGMPKIELRPRTANKFKLNWSHSNWNSLVIRAISGRWVWSYHSEHILERQGNSSMLVLVPQSLWWLRFSQWLLGRDSVWRSPWTVTTCQTWNMRGCLSLKQMGLHELHWRKCSRTLPVRTLSAWVVLRRDHSNSVNFQGYRSLLLPKM